VDTVTIFVPSGFVVVVVVVVVIVVGSGTGMIYTRNAKKGYEGSWIVY
jgi:hypothetical protein